MSHFAIKVKGFVDHSLDGTLRNGYGLKSTCLDFSVDWFIVCPLGSTDRMGL